MSDAFYLPLGDGRYLATKATEGPWGPEAQHGGPPTALLVHALERCSDRADMLTTRVSADLVAPVPMGELAVETRMMKNGRNAQLLEAVLSTEGQAVMRARAWRLRRTALSGLVDTGDMSPPPLPVKAVSSPIGFDFGYARAIEWRVAEGDTTGPGPGTVWTQLNAAVVDGHEPSPVERVAAAADSGSGISAVLDWTRWAFLNVDLTVHLFRPPRGPWVCLDSRTQLDTAGTAIASTTLFDLDGRIGTAAQSLLVAPR